MGTYNYLTPSPLLFYNNTNNYPFFQIKIWFQNKRAKLKKASGDKGDLAKMLEAQGLYNHQTVPIDDDEYPGY